MNERKNIIEKIKSLIIVVLTLSTILLLYVFWEDVDLAGLSIQDLPELDIGFDNKEPRTTFPRDVLLPTEMQIGTGADEYIVRRDCRALFGSASDSNTFMGSLNEMLTAGETFSEEITEEQYKEASSYALMRARFEYLLPPSDLFTLLGVEDLSGIDGITTISEIGYSAAAPDSVLIADESAGKYFRIVSTNGRDFLKEYMVSAGFFDATYYYRVDAIMGTKGQSDLLLPIYLESDLQGGQVLSGREVAQDALVAKSFFGDAFDFARKIADSSGKVTYMYGYGEAVLILGTDGSIEYKTEAAGKSEQNYMQALDTALAFFDEHKSFSSTSGAVEMNFRLASATKEKDSYLFTFDGELDGTELFFDGNAPLVIEVNGGVVTHFYCFQPQFLCEKSEMREAYSAINLLAANNLAINHAFGVDYSLEELTAHISDMSYGYLVNGNALNPVWRVHSDEYDINCYFDLFTSEQYGLD